MIAAPESKTEFLYALDHHDALRATLGLLKLSGWIAGFPTRNHLIRLRLGSTQIFDCTTEVSRPDVSAAHPALAGAANSGFSLNTYIPAGFHIGTLEYCLPGLKEWTPFHTLSIVAELSPLYAQLESKAPTEVSDENWQLQGWCFHPQSEIAELTLQFGRSECKLNHRLLRPDVAEIYPLFRTALESGYSGQLRLNPGHDPVMLTARLQNGSVLRHQLLPELNLPDQELQIAKRKLQNARASQIRLVTTAKPEVSIIIPIYNQLDYTLTCLESLVHHQGETSFEVIIIDDNSDAEVRETLGLVRELNLQSNRINQGFIYNCNFGAGLARGNYLLFLNNDTEVTAGWLEAMLAVFRERPDTGLVGAKLIYPDGNLQEAGCIMWEDGSATNFGRGEDPSHAEFNYLRTVDYCSGACLLIKRGFFKQLGGFDPRYRPAYYEDSDLAFAVRAAGKNVYYQPKAVIIHHEGVSGGTDLGGGVKRHQAINRGKFAEKWATAIAGLGSDSRLQRFSRDRQAWARVLVIDACALSPDADSGSLRMYNLLRMLSRLGLKVTFAAHNLQVYQPFSDNLQQEGVEHLRFPQIGNLADWLGSHAYMFDLIVLSRKEIATTYLNLIRKVAPQTRVVFDTVDLMFLRFQRQAELETSSELQSIAASSKAEELALCEKSDHIFVVSPVEAELLKSHINADKISLISNIHETVGNVPAFEGRSGVLFVGGYQHPPNVDAVEFFLDEIFPIIIRKLPDLVFHVVGSNVPDRILRRRSPNVVIHGFVADLKPLYGQVRLCVAPLRYGAGVKGKVNQSMAHGVPVVATPIAAEGMFITHGRDALIAATPLDFAAEVVRAYTEPALWQNLSQGGLDNINNHFSFAAVQSKVTSTLDHLIGPFGQVRPIPRRAATDYIPGTLIRFGAHAQEAPYLEMGWSHPDENSRWTIGRKASMRLKLPAGFVPESLRVAACPLLAMGKINRQRIGLNVPNGPTFQTYEIVTPGPAELLWKWPAQSQAQEILELDFTLPDAVSPATYQLSGDLRMLSFSFSEFTLSGRFVSS